MVEKTGRQEPAWPARRGGKRKRVKGKQEKVLFDKLVE